MAHLLDPTEDLTGVGAGSIIFGEERVEHVEEDIHAY